MADSGEQRSSGGAQPSAEFSGKTVADLREALAKGAAAPLNLLVLTRERIEEVMADAVSRGRMTADDAQELVQGLVSRGRTQTSDVLGDLERLLGSSFPISGYDDLTAAQILGRLDELTPAELRKVRSYEQNNANRKTVLSAIDSRLG